MILNMVEPKSKFKSSCQGNFTEAYFNAFLRFLQLISEDGQKAVLRSFHNKYKENSWGENIKSHHLADLNAENLSLYPDEFYQFIAIFFPKQKLKIYDDIFKGKGSQTAASESSNALLVTFPTNGPQIIAEGQKYRKSTNKEELLKFTCSNLMYLECLKLVFKLGKGGSMTEACDRELREFICYPLDNYPSVLS